MLGWALWLRCYFLKNLLDFWKQPNRIHCNNKDRSFDHYCEIHGPYIEEGGGGGLVLKGGGSGVCEDLK